jgi:hypothetical protein
MSKHHEPQYWLQRIETYRDQIPKKVIPRRTATRFSIACTMNLLGRQTWLLPALVIIDRRTFLDHKACRAFFKWSRAPYAVLAAHEIQAFLCFLRSIFAGLLVIISSQGGIGG